jgi:hypothetical protein
MQQQHTCKPILQLPQVGSMKAPAGPATLARLERWAHDEEAAGFHVPLQTPQIASVGGQQAE